MCDGKIYPCVFQEDEVPVPEPPPSSEETKPAEGKGSEAEGATTQPPAAATAEAKDGAKKKDKGAGAGEKKEEGGEGGEKKKEGGEGEGEAEGPVLNPTRWQDSKLWVVDQDQARFLAKVTLAPFLVLLLLPFLSSDWVVSYAALVDLCHSIISLRY